MTGDNRGLKRLRSLLREVKTYLKYQWQSILIGMLSVLGGWWIEPFLTKDTVCLFVLSICVTISALFLVRYNQPRISLILSLLAISFHSYAHYTLLRQGALALVMAGCGLCIWDLIQRFIFKGENDK
jgi:hypothetical protein